jgi:hypothetical protein
LLQALQEQLHHRLKGAPAEHGERHAPARFRHPHPFPETRGHVRQEKDTEGTDHGIEIIAAEVERRRVHYVQVNIVDAEFLNFLLQPVKHGLRQVNPRDAALITDDLRGRQCHRTGAGRDIQELRAGRGVEPGNQTIRAKWKETQRRVVVTGGHAVKNRNHALARVL